MSPKYFCSASCPMASRAFRVVPVALGAVRLELARLTKLPATLRVATFLANLRSIAASSTPRIPGRRQKRRAACSPRGRVATDVEAVTARAFAPFSAHLAHSGTDETGPP